MNDYQKSLMQDIKDQATELMDLIDQVDQRYDVRSSHIAKRKLEECVMWAVRGLAIEAEK
ncbi:MAG: hypothetical protein JAY71_19355 [Candidatus Thiodiazotropha weberae]|nr:hypothetical protein [Candidatus Thiodiazotropha weberae]